MKYFEMRKVDVCVQDVSERGLKGRKNGGF